MALSEIKKDTYEWIDMQCPTEEELQNIAKKYNLNYYTLQDSLEPNHLPKFESQDNFNFFIVRIIRDNISKKATIANLSNKIAVFYNEQTIITIHRIEMPFIEEIKSKYIVTDKISTTNSIAIKILWYVFNTYNSTITKTINKTEVLENRLFSTKPLPNILEHIYHLKVNVNLCVKMLILSNDVINSIKPTKQEKPALQDVKDLHVKLTTLYGQVADDLSNLMNLHISLSSQKANDIMKTLTIFSIFFMPITFIAGVYGMNFPNMPELKLSWGYPASLILMLVVVITIYFWLKKKKWL